MDLTQVFWLFLYILVTLDGLYCTEQQNVISYTVELKTTSSVPAALDPPVEGYSGLLDSLGLLDLGYTTIKQHAILLEFCVVLRGVR